MLKPFESPFFKPHIHAVRADLDGIGFEEIAVTELVPAGLEIELELMYGTGEMTRTVDIAIYQRRAGMRTGGGKAVPFLLGATQTDLFAIYLDFGDIAGAPPDLSGIARYLMPFDLFKTHQ